MASETTVYDQASDILATNEGKAGGLSFEKYVDVISGATELPDQEIDMRSVMVGILSSSSMEEAAGERSAAGLADYVGEQIIVNDFRLNKSDPSKFASTDKSPAYFAAIDATVVRTGERVVLTTGAGRVLAQLGVMLKLGQWSETYEIRDNSKTAGRNLYTLVLVPTGFSTDE